MPEYKRILDLKNVRSLSAEGLRKVRERSLAFSLDYLSAFLNVNNY